MLTIVCGPPCSGKSTYVREHARPGEPVLDWDQVWAEVTGTRPHFRDVDGRSGMEQRTEVLFRQRLERQREGWAIRTAPRRQHRAIMRRLYGARTVLLLVPIEECLRRLEQDDRRGDKAVDAERIRRWWAEYDGPSRSTDEQVLPYR